MIDSRNQLPASFQLILHIERLEKTLRADLNTVAQSHCLYRRITQHIARENPHGIGIIQKQSIRAHLGHILCKAFQHRNRAQPSHDAPDSERVRNRLPQTILLWNLKIRDRTRIISSHLDGIHHEIRSP